MISEIFIYFSVLLFILFLISSSNTNKEDENNNTSDDVANVCRRVKELEQIFAVEYKAKAELGLLGPPISDDKQWELAQKQCLEYRNHRLNQNNH